MLNTIKRNPNKILLAAALGVLAASAGCDEGYGSSYSSYGSDNFWGNWYTDSYGNENANGEGYVCVDGDCVTYGF